MRTLQFCNLVFSAVRNSGLWACSASLRGGTQCQPAPVHQSFITLWVLVSECTWESCTVQSLAESLDSGCRLLHSCLPWLPNESSLILFNSSWGTLWVHLNSTFGDHICAKLLKWGPRVSVFSVVFLKKLKTKFLFILCLSCRFCPLLRFRLHTKPIDCHNRV